ncbi:MAG: L,D-transpeptidase family protein [Rhodobacter sp.]|nr:L,D-transpeptidase family protein [Rhodobacter sp.]
MKIFKGILILSLLLGLSACSSKFRTYHGPEVTRIVVLKGERRMLLYHGTEVLAAHRIDLGFAPAGHKQFEGDGKTPEGRYLIDRRNPDSSFHLSLGISYPNAADIEAARAAGKNPGGDIFIHGKAKPGQKRGEDWTAGCISVSNREIERIYAMVKDGTVIDIYP